MSIRTKPPVCLVVTIVKALSGRFHFKKEFAGKEIIMDDGEKFTVFRHMTLDRIESKSPAIFIARFKFRKLTEKANRKASLMPVPLIAGFPGFMDKVWMSNEDTGYWQGLYQWESIEAIERYKESFVLSVMNRRAIHESLSYEIIPNTLLVDYIADHVVD